jgi:hypothetical protein
MSNYNKQEVRGGLNWLTVGLVLAALLVSGAFYRVGVSEIGKMSKRHIRLPLPLSEVPKIVCNWTGTDVSISETIQEVAGNDDFLSRVYIDKQTNQSANIYLGYSARPRTMVGHKPSVCYPANGWIYDEHRDGNFISRGGRRISYVMHKFHKPMSKAGEVFVLNYYVINGRITTDERSFEGLGWRTPNIEGAPARYIAQIQISSSSENSTIKLAEDVTDKLLELLPDENGRVRAVK